MRGALLAAAAAERLSAGVRLEALGAIPNGLAEVEPAQFDFVRQNLSPGSPISVRVSAADVLSKSRLNDTQLVVLADSVRTAGPLEIERLLVPFGKSKSDNVGRAVIDALAASTALANVRAETLQELFKNSSPAVQSESQKLTELQAAGAQQRLAKIEEMLTLVTEGDIQRGQLVFNSQKAACATCHEIGYLGGTVGPDMTRIGQIRSERDLLEAILFPSASFVRSYEPITVSTTGGKVYTGTLQKDSVEEVILNINAKDTVRIPREEIDQMEPAAVSIMPAGLDQQLSSQDLADLIAFLRACK
jgi:putative heme-binding domain-containing protein